MEIATLRQATGRYPSHLFVPNYWNTGIRTVRHRDGSAQDGSPQGKNDSPQLDKIEQ